MWLMDGWCNRYTSYFLISHLFLRVSFLSKSDFFCMKEDCFITSVKFMYKFISQEMLLSDHAF